MRPRLAIRWLVVLLPSVLLICAGCARPNSESSAAPIGSASTSTAVISASGEPDPSIGPAVDTASSSAGRTLFSEVPSAAPGTGTVDETSTAAALPDCTPDALPTRAPGMLTIATGEDLVAPWFIGLDAATSDGYEASVARDVAATLGYDAERVRWMQVDTRLALAGSTADFDVLIDRVRQPESGSDVLAFSTGYYSITDALLVRRASFDALAGTRPDLRALRLGVTSGSSGQAAAQERGMTPTTFDSSQTGLDALIQGAIDGLLLPTPDALAASEGLDSVAVVGQLAPGQWQPEQFHIVLANDSPLTSCVTAAVDRLRIEGTLDALTQRWITPLAPVIG